MKWIIRALVIAVALTACALAWTAARQMNPSRPYIGEPNARHYEFFARRFNNLMVERGRPITEYKADLHRTDSVTNPLVGEFDCAMDWTPVKFRFAWKDGRWVEMDGRFQDVADEAQK